MRIGYALIRVQNLKRHLSIYLKTYLAIIARCAKERTCPFARDDLLNFRTMLPFYLSQILVCQVADRASRCIYFYVIKYMSLYTVRIYQTFCDVTCHDSILKRDCSYPNIKYENIFWQSIKIHIFSYKSFLINLLYYSLYTYIIYTLFY